MAKAGRGEDGGHAVGLERGVDVDGSYASVGVRAADERGVQQAGPGLRVQVGREAAPAEEHPAVLFPRHRGADPLAHVLLRLRSLASARARETRVAVSLRRYSLLPCVSSGGSIAVAACSPMACQVSGTAGCPASTPDST